MKTSDTRRDPTNRRSETLSKRQPSTPGGHWWRPLSAALAVTHPGLGAEASGGFRPTAHSGLITGSCKASTLVRRLFRVVVAAVALAGLGAALGRMPPIR